jgi:hypothetical protein
MNGKREGGFQLKAKDAGDSGHSLVTPRRPAIRPFATSASVDKSYILTPTGFSYRKD